MNDKALSSILDAIYCMKVYGHAWPNFWTKLNIFHVFFKLLKNIDKTISWEYDWGSLPEMGSEASFFSLQLTHSYVVMPRLEGPLHLCCDPSPQGTQVPRFRVSVGDIFKICSYFLRIIFKNIFFSSVMHHLEGARVPRFNWLAHILHVVGQVNKKGPAYHTTKCKSYKNFELKLWF